MNKPEIIVIEKPEVIVRLPELEIVIHRDWPPESPSMALNTRVTQGGRLGKYYFVFHHDQIDEIIALLKIAKKYPPPTQPPLKGSSREEQE